MTVSTVGLAPAIRRLADEGMSVTLAVSLHTLTTSCATPGPGEQPLVGGRGPEAARYYADTTGRRVSIEYALIRDVNDQPWRADMLGAKLREALGSLVHVNLIPLNPTPGSEWDASPKPVEREFVARVREQGVPAQCATRVGKRLRPLVVSWPQKTASGQAASLRPGQIVFFNRRTATMTAIPTRKKSSTWPSWLPIVMPSSAMMTSTPASDADLRPKPCQPNRADGAATGSRTHPVSTVG